MFAVKGVNLNIYKGEITALLGHNGAGKTTTMSILTGENDTKKTGYFFKRNFKLIDSLDRVGLTSASAGSIHYKNIDVLQNMSLFREKLGMCPQEDRLFPYLSVMDHLLFFGMVGIILLLSVSINVYMLISRCTYLSCV